MSWGVFDLKLNGFVAEIHVIPCRKCGHMLPPHSLTVQCVCGPTLEDNPGGKVPVYIHKQEQ